MIKLFYSNEMKESDILNREIQNNDEVEDIVADIINDVRANGDQALLDYCKKFDHADLDSLEASQEEIDDAYNSIDPEFIQTLKMARDNIEAFHRQQVRKNFVINDKEGIVLGQKVTPIEKVGLYVPGGTASYPSSVLIAKVACVTRIIKSGGAQAVAALAYGTETVPKVDKIVGPGNIFVATAKRRVYGIVDIDMIAGPSEILVIADGSCNPSYVAADLLSQAEHDKLATAVLITDSKVLAEKVQQELEVQIPQLLRSEIARTSIDQNGKIIVADSIQQAVEISNRIAPEHLEICVDDPFAVLNSIQNAGSIFLGKNVPEALGDYFAGPNHTLPTSGTARFSSPLSVSQVQERVVDFATREGLTGHAKSVSIRFES